MYQVKALIVDDDNLIRIALTELIGKFPEIEVVGAVASGEEAIAFLSENPSINIVFLDLNMPGMGGFEATKQIRKQYPDKKVIILTASHSDILPNYLLKAGASAYLTKNSQHKEILDAVKEVLKGKPYISKELLSQLAYKLISFKNSPFEKLSPTEMEVLFLMFSDMRIVDIATYRNKSPKTISTLKMRIFEKLGIKTDLELMRLAIQCDIISK